MTREEAKKILEAYIACESKKAHFECSEYNCDDTCPLLYDMGTVGEYNEAINMAIQALSQEPCTDAVSREDALKLIYDFKEKHTEDREKHPINYGTLLDLIRLIRKLPSVTQKSGKWIEDAKTYYEELNKRGLGVDEYTPYFTDDIACSVCLAKYNTCDNETQFFKYCPNCGAKMVEPQESEVRNEQ